MSPEYRICLYAECEFCGRQWFVDVEDRGWEGFLSLPVSNHRVVCAERTPEERRTANNRDERRWSKHPPHARIVNAVSHIGLVSAVDAASNKSVQRIGETVPLPNKEPDIQELIDDQVSDFLANR